MEDRYSIKRITAYICMILFAIFCIVMLVFSTVNTTGDLAKYSDVSPDSGFKWMTFQSDFISGFTWEIASIPLGILTILQLIFGMCALFLVVYNFITYSDEKNIIVLILGVLSMIVYTAEGIAVTSILNQNSYNGYKNYYVTAAFIPLLIGVTLALIAISCIFSNSYLYINTRNTQRFSHTSSTKEVDKIDLLEKYKNLLEKQVITKEEFEAKKKELLNI